MNEEWNTGRGMNGSYSIVRLFLVLLFLYSIIFYFNYRFRKRLSTLINTS